MAISKIATYDVLKHYLDGLTIHLRLNVTRKVLYIGLLSLLEQFTINTFYELFSLLCWNFAIIFSTKLSNVLTMSKKILSTPLWVFGPINIGPGRVTFVKKSVAETNERTIL